VKKRPLAQTICRGQMEGDTTTGTEDSASEAYETVLTEDETGHDEIVQSPNRTIIEDHTTRITDEDMTTVLRPRSRKQQKEYTPRRTVSPRRPRTTRSRKPEMQIEDKMEASQSTAFGVNEGIYGEMKNAIQEMTAQIVTTIQAAFNGMRSNPDHNTNTNSQKTSESISKPTRTRVEEKRRPKKKRSTTSVKTMYSYDDTSQSSDNEARTDDESDFESINTSQIVEPRFNRSNSNTISRLPAFTGKEKWEVWINRFEAVSRLHQWNDECKLKELLPRLQGEAGDFAFDQLSERTLSKYSKLVKELQNRFGIFETKKNYRVQFNRRNQKSGETPEAYAAELKRIYDKAYTNRDAKIRQEDLLQRFLMGLIDNKTRIHIELTKDPRSVEEAVHEVITYLETTNYSQYDDQVSGRNKRVVRQVKRNINDNTKANWKTGKLNGKRTQDMSPEIEHKDGPTSDTMALGKVHVDMLEVQQLFERMFRDKRNEEGVKNSNFQSQGAPISNLPYNNRTDFRGQTRNSGPQKGNMQNGQFQQNSSVRTTLLCFQCGQPGHYARNCFSNPNRQPNRHQTRTQADIHSTPWTGNKKQDENQRTQGTDFTPNTGLGSVSGLALN